MSAITMDPTKHDEDGELFRPIIEHSDGPVEKGRAYEGDTCPECNQGALTRQGDRLFCDKLCWRFG